MPHLHFAPRALLLALALLTWSDGAAWADDPPLVSQTLEEQLWVAGAAHFYDVPVFFTDPDTSFSTYDFTASQMDGSPLPTWLAISPGGKLTNTGAAVPPGIYRLLITATNRIPPHHHVSAPLRLVVRGHAPTCSDVTVNVVQGSTHRFTAEDFGFGDALDSPPDAFLGLHFDFASQNLFVNNITCRPDMVFHWEPLLGYESEERSLPSLASALAISPDGSVIAVADYDGHLRITSDDGQNWQEIGPTGKIIAVRFRGSSTKLLAIADDGRRFWTDDGGAAWAQYGSGNYVGSDDGQIQLRNNTTGLLRTVDAGMTWQGTGPSGTWSAYASSTDGTHLAAALRNNNMDTIYVSTDTGVTWEATARFASGTNPTQLKCSADGTTLFYGERIISEDGGHVWRSIFSKEMAAHSLLAFSADARAMVSRSGSELFFSSDTGLHWHREPRRQGTTAVAFSDDGTKMVGIKFADTLRILRHATPVLEYEAPPNAYGLDQTTFTVMDTGPAYFLDRSNESTEQTLTVNIVSHFQVWAQEHGLPTDATAADGQNLLRYAFGLESDGSDAAQVIALNGSAFTRGGPALLGAPSIGPLRILFGRRKNSGLTYRVEFSSDLKVWHLDFSTPTILADDGTIEACAVDFPAQLPTSQTPMYARLRVIH